MNIAGYILYENLTQKQKEEIKELYYKKENVNKTLNEIRTQLNFGISERAFNKVLKNDFNINLRRRTKYNINENFFEIIDTPEKAYILGYIAADGFIGEESNTISIFSNDKEILEKMKKIMDFTGEIKKTKKGGFENSKEGNVLYINSIKMKKDLNNLGLYSKKSLTFNKIPQIPNELKRHFLRGYFDGDGSITTYERTYKIKGKKYKYNRLTMTIIATEELLNDFIKTFNLEKYSITKSKTPNLKYIFISSKKQLIEIYELMYKDSTISLNRKREIWDKNIVSL